MNARKYAEAEKIVIRLEQTNSILRLEVEDDGKGFDLPEVGSDSLELRLMRHRTELVGANFTIEPVPGAGTHVQCTLPV